MPDTLTELIAKVQALLIDDGTNFATATCTAAIREALSTFNEYLPINAAELIDAVSDQLEYELSDYDSRATSITDVLLQDSNSQEVDVSLTFDQYTEDERLFFRLRYPQATGETIIARYAVPHTINGLDSETESTIPAPQTSLLVKGAAAEALRARAYARVETINLNKDVSDNYRELSAIYGNEFILRLTSLAGKKRTPVSEPDTHHWSV